jgi:hypothetical protein
VPLNRAIDGMYNKEYDHEQLWIDSRRLGTW